LNAQGFEKFGKVTDKEIAIDGVHFGGTDECRNVYDEALGLVLEHE